MGVLTSPPGIATHELPATESYRVGVAVLDWLRANLAHVAIDIRPPSCGQTVERGMPPAAAQLVAAIPPGTCSYSSL